MVNHTGKGYGEHSVYKMHTPIMPELSECIQEYKNPLTDTSTERKCLLEDFRSGYITAEELQEELAILKDKDNEN